MLKESTIVESSVFHRLSYDEKTRKLLVEFHNSAEIFYFGVPPEVYVAFRDSPSKGSFYNTDIKPRFKWRYRDRSNF